MAWQVVLARSPAGSTRSTFTKDLEIKMAIVVGEKVGLEQEQRNYRLPAGLPVNSFWFAYNQLNWHFADLSDLEVEEPAAKGRDFVWLPKIITVFHTPGCNGVGRLRSRDGWGAPDTTKLEIKLRREGNVVIPYEWGPNGESYQSKYKGRFYDAFTELVPIGGSLVVRSNAGKRNTWILGLVDDGRIPAPEVEAKMKYQNFVDQKIRDLRGRNNPRSQDQADYWDSVMEKMVAKPKRRRSKKKAESDAE